MEAKCVTQSDLMQFPLTVAALFYSEAGSFGHIHKLKLELLQKKRCHAYIMHDNAFAF
jgi:hypothetical protein